MKYANDNSPFYKKWFRENGINPKEIQSHEDLLSLPIISGKKILENQPPSSQDFNFRSVEKNAVFTIHETSGTSGMPKAFFLTWDDWQRYAEKYARSFVSQGFAPGDTVVLCSAYGMNVGANMMTLAANNVGFTIIPEGKSTFPLRVITSYKPTGLVGSVFKLLQLAREMAIEGIVPSESGVKTLVVGGESFAEESRIYLSEVWKCKVYNTYGSTEGTMCGECGEINGLHVPEDLVHLDLYNPSLNDFVQDGECGRIILTTLIPPGGRCGTILLNYDTEDTSVVKSRDKCSCGRTHMRILNPQRESETFWVTNVPFNRVNVEQGVFQRENMDYLTGEYEAFLFSEPNEGHTILQVNLECLNKDNPGRNHVEANFLRGFLKNKPLLAESVQNGSLEIGINFLGIKELEMYRRKGRPKRIIDRRQ